MLAADGPGTAMAGLAGLGAEDGSTAFCGARPAGDCTASRGGFFGSALMATRGGAPRSGCALSRTGGSRSGTEKSRRSEVRLECCDGDVAEFTDVSGGPRSSLKRAVCSGPCFGVLPEALASSGLRRSVSPTADTPSLAVNGSSRAVAPLPVASSAVSLPCAPSPTLAARACCPSPNHAGLMASR